MNPSASEEEKPPVNTGVDFDDMLANMLDDPDDEAGDEIEDAAIQAALIAEPEPTPYIKPEALPGPVTPERPRKKGQIPWKDFSNEIDIVMNPPQLVMSAQQEGRARKGSLRFPLLEMKVGEAFRVDNDPMSVQRKSLTADRNKMKRTSGYSSYRTWDFGIRFDEDGNAWCKRLK